MSLRTSVVLSVALLITLNFSLSGQQSFKIAKIEFEGLNRLSLDDMIATSGLKVGEQFELSALDAAAQRLMDSGFSKM